jgi:hypothetical protein
MFVYLYAPTAGCLKINVNLLSEFFFFFRGVRVFFLRVFYQGKKLFIVGMILAKSLAQAQAHL